VKKFKKDFLIQVPIARKRVSYFLRFIFPAIAAFKMASAVFLVSRTFREKILMMIIKRMITNYSDLCLKMKNALLFSCPSGFNAEWVSD